MFIMDVLVWPQIDPIVLDFHPIRKWCDLKCRLWVRKLAKIVLFAPQFFGGTYEHPHRTYEVDLAATQTAEPCNLCGSLSA